MLITITDDMTTRTKGGGGLRHSHHQTLSPSLSAPNRGDFEDGERRITRIVRLRRPQNESYGFHLRGGREHGTGFFISHVEVGSEAHSQGLRTGDQVLRVNQFSVNRALHKEVTSLVQAGNKVVLEVKSAGLIPVKNNPNDPLSWVLVESGGRGGGDNADLSTSSSLEYHRDYNSNSPGSNQVNGYANPVQIIVGGAGKNTIGCSICKGPTEKPGIFVQRVREGGMADASGLRAGDQIVSCNGISFYHIEFQQAVQAMKSSPCLRLEVLRGAGLDLVMGESSGYNSSASSETGEEPYPSSESDSREAFPHSLTSTLSRKLNCVRDQVQLDSNRDWKEIEAEWDDAEISVKRAQLNGNHRTLNSRQSHSGSEMSKSFVNLTINEDEPDTSRLAFEEGLNSRYLSPNARLSALSKPKSMIDLRNNGGSNAHYKIALQTATDAPHVSKIVIPSAPKDEQNALLRLEELSSGPKSGSSLNLNHLPLMQNHSKTCSISSTSSDEFANSGHYNNHSRNMNMTLKDNRQLIRCRSVPQDCNFASSEDSDSVLSYPSSTICVTGTGSGRYTSKILIRNNPPAPPLRDNTTKLTRHHRKLRGTHHRNQPKTMPGSLSANLDDSSSTSSPCASSGSSSAGNPQSCNHVLRHTTSFGSLSASSDESTSWDGGNTVRVATSTNQSPTQRLHDMVNCHQKVGGGIGVMKRRSPMPSSSTIPPPPPLPNSSSAIPPPPPPPPLLVPSSTGQNDVLSRQQEITGAVGKLRSSKDRPDSNLKEKPLDPKKMQHEQLMEEFKKAHARMVAKRQSSGPEESEAS